MADIRINWEPPIDKSIVDSISIYRYAGETSDCNIILNDGVLVVENLAADSTNYDDLGIANSDHYSYGVFSKNVTGFSPCAHASLSLVPTIDGSPTDLTAVYVAAAPVEGPTNIVPTIEVAPKYGIDTGIFVYPLFITEAESNYYDSQFGGTGSSHTMTYNSVTYYMPNNGSTHAGTEAPTFVTINGNDFNYAQIVTGLELGNKPSNNERPTDLTSTEEILAPTNGPTDLTSTEQIVAPTNGPTDLTSVEETLAPTSGPTDLTTLANPNDAPSVLGITASPNEAPTALGTTASPNEAPTSLTAVEEILAPTNGPTNLTTLVDADEDGHYADVDLDDNDANTGLYPANVEITWDGSEFSSTTPELYYVEGYSYIRRNGDSPMYTQAGNFVANIYIRQGQTVTFTNNTTNMFYVRKQTDLSVNLLSIMGVNAPSNTDSYTFTELGKYGWRTTDTGMVTLRFEVVPATAPLDTFQILDQGAAAGQTFAGDYNWDYYENNPSSLGWLQGIAQYGNTTFTMPSGYSTTSATILYRKTGTVWDYGNYADGIIYFESLSNGQDTKNYLYASFGDGSTSTQHHLIYEITNQRPYTLGEVLPSWFINELAAEDYHISYTKRPTDSPTSITATGPQVSLANNSTTEFTADTTSSQIFIDGEPHYSVNTAGGITLTIADLGNSVFTFTLTAPNGNSQLVSTIDLNQSTPEIDEPGWELLAKYEYGSSDKWAVVNSTGEAWPNS